MFRGKEERDQGQDHEVGHRPFNEEEGKMKVKKDENGGMMR